MKPSINRRTFLARGAVASAGFYSMTVADTLGATPAKEQAPLSPVIPNHRGSLPVGKIGKTTLSRLIAGGNLLSGWCHQRDLLFVAKLAAAYLTERKQFDTLQLFEEVGINSIVIDLMQLDILNRYKKERGGKIRAVVSVREDWGDWDNPSWKALQTQIRQTIDKGPDLLYLHGGYSDRLVQRAKPGSMEIMAKALAYMREQGFSAGVGAHALEVLRACDKDAIKPDFFVKTFHHDGYWSATPRDRRKPFCVDGPRSLDHNEFHDNIFCLDPEGTAEFMLEQTVPWIAFKVLAAGAIPPASAFQYAFENGVDFVAVGMFDFEVNDDVQALRKTLDGLQRERPWCG
ncbi:MAG TPA: hypothetical protein P5186_02795 [Candidatus Paceibacterota bacterium]|nr:hypothetical protein [Verrucomicrobiota bacterium]HRY46952.1 hypothetical protein [Candidatus Paceibacterota bacterium]HSA01741.1 hypothetical protein [Candidatus Paceibacterota bacterium]